MPSNASVFIIDDDPVYLYMLERIIRECDFSQYIHAFSNAKLALETLHSGPIGNHELPDVIFVDLSMPVMNGWEFLEKLDRLGILKKKKIKIVLISSSINPREIELIKGYPIVSKYIVKPITPSDLAAINEY